MGYLGFLGLREVSRFVDEASRQGPIDPNPTNLDRVVETYFNRLSSKEGFTALSVSISLRPQNPNLNFTVGKISRRPDAAAVTPLHLFQIGSITKSMTAAIALQLAGEGVLSLDDPLEKWLPEYAIWKDVTLRQLLNMTSGIPDHGVSRIAQGAPPELNRQFDEADLVGMIEPRGEEGPAPKGSFSYSNKNYILISMIIERATGNRFADEFRRRLLRPELGLRDTFYSRDVYPEAVLHRLVSGYYEGEEDRSNPARPWWAEVDFQRENLSWAGAAASVISTPQDVTRFLRLLAEGALLHQSEQLELRPLMDAIGESPPPQRKSKRNAAYGFGIFGYPLRESQLIGMVGGTMYGYRSVAMYFPKEQWVIAAAVNSRTSWDEDNLERLIIKLYDCLYSPRSAPCTQ